MGPFQSGGELPEVEWIAGAISERAAELLRTRISVTDQSGAVVASRAPEHFVEDNGAEGGPVPDAIHVPLLLEGLAPLDKVIVAPPPSGEEAIPARLAHALVDLVVYQLAVVDRLPNGPDLKNKLIYDLLHDAIPDQDRVLRDAKLLGIDLAPPRAVILIDAAEWVRGVADRGAEPGVPPVEMRRRSQLLIGSVVGFFLLPDDTICAASGDGEIAVLKASDSKNLTNWVDLADDPEPVGASWANLNALKRAGRALVARLGHDTGGASINVGIGRYHPGVRGLARSYKDAQAALSLGRRLDSRGRVHCLDALGIAAFVGLADERTKFELATHLLSPLDHEPALLETMRVFFDADCCPSAVAARLAIHRNTLSYRLDKVLTLTGLDPRRFDEAVQIRLALVLRSLDAVV